MWRESVEPKVNASRVHKETFLNQVLSYKDNHVQGIQILLSKQLKVLLEEMLEFENPAGFVRVYKGLENGVAALLHSDNNCL